ncbi:RICIN domain-containing protein [Paenibacillus harenae]|uniref:RICIN domain-containing protein n=1 Tax=Paenibacillus harenae TaxID=306543 RepID=UPI00049068D9
MQVLVLSPRKELGAQSGKALEVYGAGKDDGANVDIWSYGGGAHQKWKIVSNGDGTLKFVASNSNKILNVDGNGTANGTNVNIWLNSGSTGQKWKLIRR